jgi:hypothetical protein
MLPIFFDNIISKEDCNYILSVVKESNLWIKNPQNDFWSDRCLDYHLLKEKDEVAASIILFANIRCEEIIKDKYKDKEVFPDLLQIVRWFPGMRQPPHADDMTNTEVKGLEHRKYGSIIYLNDDYGGGKTFYPQHNFEITPKKGRLAIHPGTPDYMHGVSEVKNGIRYTIASFWTNDEKKSIFK